MYTGAVTPTAYSPLQTPNGSPNSSPRLQFGARTVSTQVINERFIQTQQDKVATQEGIQNAKKMIMWGSLIPIRVLTAVIKIYNKLLEGVDQDEKTKASNLRRSQADYEIMCTDVFTHFEVCQNNAIATREEECTVQCQRHYKNFTNTTKRDIGEEVVSASISELKAKMKALNRQTVTANLLPMNELKFSCFSKQLEFVEKIKEMQVECNNEMGLMEQSNPLFSGYQSHFNRSQGGAALSISKVPLNVVENAKKICSLFFQFEPDFICSSKDFSNKMELSFLERCLSIAPCTTKLKYNREELEEAIKNLRSQQKVWDGYIQEYESRYCQLVLQSESYEKDLESLDSYTEVRQEKKKATDTFADIWHAVEKGGLPSIKTEYEKLKGSTFDINVPHKVLGLTLLHIAMRSQGADVVKYLLKCNASQLAYSTFTLKNVPFSYTPLHLAAALCSHEKLMLCLEDFKHYSCFYTQFLKPESLDTATNLGLVKYTALHFLINPRLLIPDLTETDLENWRLSSPALVKLLLDKGASIHAPNCQSALLFALDECISLCHMLRRRDIWISPSSKASFDTLLALVDIFLLNKKISTNELQNAAKKLVEKKLQENEAQLWQKVVACEYFRSKSGKEFLESIEPKMNTGGSKISLPLPRTNSSLVSPKRSLSSPTTKDFFLNRGSGAGKGNGS
ncbi:MAG: hypothetical protein JSR46_00495 [Verrucomicrobia bacterium]|nr:hypothetical protein [Verrucomicrobiota bacterium]